TSNSTAARRRASLLASLPRSAPPVARRGAAAGRTVLPGFMRHPLPASPRPDADATGPRPAATHPAPAAPPSPAPSPTPPPARRSPPARRAPAAPALSPPAAPDRSPAGRRHASG